MGYDMSICQTIPEEAAALAAARDQFQAALKERDTLEEEGPKWFSPEEELLPEEERKAIGQAHLAEVDRLVKEEGLDFMEARSKAGSVQPSEAWLAAQQKVIQAGDQQDQANISYFRLNIWGMSRMRDDMAKLEMLAWNYYDDDRPGWPDQPEKDDAVWDLDEDERLNHPDPTWSEYFKAVAAVKSWSPPDEPGIPVHKFGSNDGWHVTPLDIRGALAAYRRADPELVAKVREEWKDRNGGENYFDAWIAYLERAEKFDGFLVW